MILISRWARVWTSILALCLLVPTLGIATQDDAALEQFHNRKLSTWPEAGSFRDDPVQYFGRVKTWLAERVYPVEQVTHFQKTMAFSLLGVMPEPRVTLGADGHIFLNSGNNSTLNELFDTACVQAHTARVATMLEGALTAWAQTSQRLDLSVDVVDIPTAASLYADKLPKTTPEVYRRACLERTAGNSPLLSIRTPPEVSFVYPLRELLAARGDDALFPRGNWHPTGLSLKVVRDTYLARLHATGSIDEELELGEAPAEILTPYDIRKYEPTYSIRNHHVTLEAARSSVVKLAIADLLSGDRFVAHVFTNSKPVIDQKVLMISDSFGDLAAEVFAGAFRQLVHVNVNTLHGGRALELVGRVRKVEPFDRLILLVQEGDTSRIAEWHE